MTCDIDVRLHSATGYVAPGAKLEGRDEAIWAERRKYLAKANRKRNLVNQYRSQCRNTGCGIRISVNCDSRLIV